MDSVTPKSLAKDLRQRIKEIDSDLASVRSLIDERERLVGALSRLEAVGDSPPPRASQKGGGARRRARKRRNGSNREQIIKFLGELGRAATAKEVSTATGIPRTSVATAMSGMAKRGDLKKAERGYKVSS